MKGMYFYTGVFGLTSGIFLRSFFDWGRDVVLLLLMLTAVYFVLSYLRGRRYESVFFLGGLFLLSYALGMVRFHSIDSAPSPLEAFVDTRVVREGVVVREPDVRDTSQHLYIRDEETGALFLAYADPYLAVAYGDRVNVTGELVLPEPFETELGREFDYPEYLKAHGVREVVYRARVDVLGHGEGHVILTALLTLKQKCIAAIERAIPEPAAGLGEGVLLGVKRAIGEDLEEVFRTVGIIHIVVLSGYNIMIVAEWVMRFFGLFFYPKTRLVLGLSTIVLFALMVGLSATVVRAAIMVALVIIARALGRPFAALRALACAGTVMILHNPYLMVFDPGFQLSFLATLGLVLLSDPLKKRMTLVPEEIRGVLSTTLATQLCVLPLILFSIGTLSIVSILANILVLPLVPPAMLLTFLTGVVGVLAPSLGVLTGLCAHIVLMYIITVGEVFSRVPFASLAIPVFPWWIMGLLYALILFVVYRLHRRDLESTLLLSTKNQELTIPTNNDYKDWIIEEVRGR